MKETEDFARVEAEITTPVPTEKRLLGSKPYIQGLPIWKINMNTLEVEKAVPDDVLAVPDKNGMVQKRIKITAEPAFWYVQVINKKNAIRKYMLGIKKIMEAQGRLATKTGQDG